MINKESNTVVLCSLVQRCVFMYGSRIMEFFRYADIFPLLLAFAGRLFKCNNIITEVNHLKKDAQCVAYPCTLTTRLNLRTRCYEQPCNRKMWCKPNALYPSYKMLAASVLRENVALPH